LMAVGGQNNIPRIMILSTVEITVCIVISILPALSSSFTKRYMQSGSASTKPTIPSRLKIGRLNNSTFAQLSGNNTTAAKDGSGSNDIEICELGNHALGFAEARGSGHSPTDSTDQILEAGKGGITMMTHVTVTRER